MSTSIREFFKAYARATGSPDTAFLESAYAETFMFAGPGAVRAVKRDDFLKVVPKRSALFRAAGQVGSDVTRVDETRLDDLHTTARVHWALRFDRDGAPAIVAEVETTYVLRRHADSWQIIFQLDHQDLSRRVQELGIALPSAG